MQFSQHCEVESVPDVCIIMVGLMVGCPKPIDDKKCEIE